MFDKGFKVRGVFLKVSKAFDKVCYENLFLKLNQNGICGNHLNILLDFLSCQKRQVVQNGQHLSWDNVTAEFLQGSSLFFYLHK